MKMAIRVNGARNLCLTKLDVLDGIEEIKVCTAYSYKRKILKEFPLSRLVQEKARPVYISFPGWKEKTRGITRFDKLPLNAKRYVRHLEKLCGSKVSILSMGRSREETIILDRSFLR
ncbi:MAG TPA: adenylosuccinate synthetase, partial [bacterium]|nr:adenylosuccinate synthetase [bacterium]